MTKVKDKHPPPHATYLVEKNNYYFVATPCYGMHSPWWIPMTHDKELDPIQILEIDAWISLEEIKQNAHKR